MHRRAPKQNACGRARHGGGEHSRESLQCTLQKGMLATRAAEMRVWRRTMHCMAHSEKYGDGRGLPLGHRISGTRRSSDRVAGKCRITRGAQDSRPQAFGSSSYSAKTSDPFGIKVGGARAGEEGMMRSRRRETTPGRGSPLNGDILAETSGLGGAQKGTQYCRVRHRT